MTAGLPFPNNASVVTRYLRSITHLMKDICPTSIKDEATIGTRPALTGAIDPELKRLALEEYKGQFGLRGH
eukprot:scaffold27852_cov73-Skeletonema_marinoi.AAC.1